jgi:hypothetical protein
MSDNDLSGYYVIKPDNLITLTKNINQKYYISCDIIQEAVISTQIEEWEQNNFYRLMSYYTSLRNVMNVLDEIINKPSKESLRLTKKHKIDGILVEEPTLQKLNASLLIAESVEAELEIDQKRSAIVH